MWVALGHDSGTGRRPPPRYYGLQPLTVAPKDFFGPVCETKTELVYSLFYFLYQRGIALGMHFKLLASDVAFILLRLS
jgi:hypothetical protein